MAIHRCCVLRRPAFTFSEALLKAGCTAADTRLIRRTSWCRIGLDFGVRCTDQVKKKVWGPSIKEVKFKKKIMQLQLLGFPGTVHDQKIKSPTRSKVVAPSALMIMKLKSPQLRALPQYLQQRKRPRQHPPARPLEYRLPPPQTPP
jgi:hypothetical protein